MQDGIPGNDGSNYFRKLFSPQAGSAAAFTAAAWLLGQYWYVFVDVIRGKKDQLGDAGLITIIIVGLLILGLVLKRLIPRTNILPGNWASLVPDKESVVESPNQSQLLQERLVPKIVAVVTGASGAGKTTMLNNEIRVLVSANKNDDDKGFFFYLDNYTAPKQDIRMQRLKMSELSKRAVGGPTASFEESDDDYLASFAEDLREVAQILLSATEKGYVHLVLDQFESELANAAINNRACKIYHDFLDILILSERISLAIVVRKEWLCDAMRFLESLRLPYNVVFVPPIDKLSWEMGATGGPSQAETTAGWVDYFYNRGIQKELSSQIARDLSIRPNGFLQIEARIAFIVVKYFYEGTLTRDQYARIGRVDGLIQRYFDSLLGAAPTGENVATKILVALASDSWGFGLVRSSLDIARLIHEPEGRVGPTVEFLERYGILTRGTPVEPNETSLGNKYANSEGYLLRHDYVSDFARNSPAININSTDRDNIRTFVDDVAKKRPWIDFILYTPPKELTISRLFIGLYIVAAVFSLVLINFSPEWFLERATKAFTDVESAKTVGEKIKMYLSATMSGKNPVWHGLDAGTFSLYQSVITLAIASTQLLYLAYVDLINRGFFHVVGKRRVVDETDLIKPTHYQYIVIAAALSSIYSLIACPYFLFWPAICGALVGGSQIFISKEKGLSVESKLFISSLGKKTVINMVICAVVATLSLLAAEYLSAFVLARPEVALAVYLAFATFMIAFVLQIFKVHTSGDALSRRRAHYDRRVRGIEDLSDLTSAT